LVWQLQLLFIFFKLFDLSMSAIEVIIKRVETGSTYVKCENN